MTQNRRNPFTNQLVTRIRDNVRSANRTGNLIQAIVTDVFNDRVSVQLGTNGGRMEGLSLIGGPVKVLDAVQVDFSGDPPVVIAKGNEYLSQSDLEAALRNLSGENGTGRTTLEIVLFSGGGVVGIFPPSSDGMQLAINSAGIGDVIWLPDVDITTDIELPEGVTLSGVSSRQSVIRGTVTLNDDCALENVKVVCPQWSEEDSVGVICQALSKTAWIRNAEVHAYHCAIGDAYGIQMGAGTFLNVDQSTIVGATGTGSSYAFMGATDSYVKVTHSRIFGLTDWFFDDGNFEVYANVDGASELEYWCVVEPFYRWSGSFNNDNQAQTDYYYPKIIQKPPTPTASTIQSGATGSYPGVVARMGDYVYIHRDPELIREINVTTGDNVDLAIDASYANFVVIDDRRLLYVGADGDDHAVKLLNFDDETVSTVYTFPVEIGDYETENTFWYNSPSHAMIVTQENGDLFVVFIGDMQKYFLDTDPDWYYSSGVYFLTINWTQGGDWELSETLLKPVDNFYNDTVNLYLPPTAVHGRYVTLIPSWDIAGAEVWPPPGSAHGGLAYHVMVVLDLDDMSTHITRDSLARAGSSPDPTFYYGGTDHVNQKVYAHYYTDDDLVMCQFDPVAEAIEIHQTFTAPTDVVYMFNNSKCYYMHCIAPGDADIYNADTNVVVLEEWDMPHYLYNEMDWVMDDNNRRFWYFNKNTSAIVGVNPETGAQTSFASGVTPAAVSPNNNWLYALGNVFIVFVSKTAGNNYEHYLIKD